MCAPDNNIWVRNESKSCDKGNNVKIAAAHLTIASENFLKILEFIFQGIYSLYWYS